MATIADVVTAAKDTLAKAQAAAADFDALAQQLADAQAKATALAGQVAALQAKIDAVRAALG